MLERCPVLDVTGLRFDAPVARPTAVICIGQNYAAHAAECSDLLPDVPIVLLKHQYRRRPKRSHPFPRRAAKLDWEVKVGVVIGRRCRYLTSDADAIAHVAGFCVSHDVSERAFQFELSGGQWSNGNCCESFDPLGPGSSPPGRSTRGRCGWLLREPPPTTGLHTADMIFPVATPGASPQRVHGSRTWRPDQHRPNRCAVGPLPYLSAGDVVTLEIDKPGQQRQVVQ